MGQTESQRLAPMPKPTPTPDQTSTVESYLSIVRLQARRIHRRLPLGVDYEDLYSAGLVGLWKAHLKFDPANRVPFETYAQFRVRGAILDSLRISDWAPRGLRSKGRAAQEAIRVLNSRLRRSPTEDEIAAELGLSTLEYQQLRGELHGLEFGTLYRRPDEETGDEELVPIADREENDPFFRCLEGEVTKRLAEAIEELPERERLVITLYYHEELTQQEISLALETSESRIQQIRNSAVLRLRSALSDLRVGRAVSPRAISKSNAKKPPLSHERSGSGRLVSKQTSSAIQRRNLAANPEPCVSPVGIARALSAMQSAQTTPLL